MARIRSIKPEFPQSESMGAVSRDARLLFALVWTVCDDEGRTRGASRMLASLLFPYDDDAPKLIDGWLAELEREQCIVRYQVAGSTYLQVRNWLTHQKIDKPSKSRLPAFVESSRILANVREASTPDLDLDLGPRTMDLGPGKAQQALPPKDAEADDVDPPDSEDDSPADDGADEDGPPAPEKPKPATTSIGTRLPEDWAPSATLLAWAADEFPGVNAKQATEEFRDYWHPLPGPKGRKLDWDKTWKNRIRQVAASPRARGSPQTGFSMERVRKSAEEFADFDLGAGNARRQDH